MPMLRPNGDGLTVRWKCAKSHPETLARYKADIESEFGIPVVTANSKKEAVQNAIAVSAGRKLDVVLLFDIDGELPAAERRLSGVQRGLIEQAFFLGFTQSELAERHGLPLGTVKTRIRTGLRTLRGQLDGRYIQQ